MVSMTFSSFFIVVSLASATNFLLTYDLACPMPEKTFEYAIYIYEIDFWKSHNLVAKKRGLHGGPDNLRGQLGGTQDGDEILSGDYEIGFAISHTCSVSGQKRCWYQRVGNCEYNWETCFLVVNSTLFDDRRTAYRCKKTFMFPPYD